MHNQATIVDGPSFSVDCKRFDLMFAIRSRLHHHGSRFSLMHVDQSDADLIGRQTIDERRDVGRQSRAAVLRIEIPQPSV